MIENKYTVIKITVFLLLFLFFLPWIPYSFAAVKFIPIPAFSTNPNEGESYGLLPVWLVLDDKKEITKLFAHSISYNDIFGITGTFRLFGYPKSGKKYELIFARSTEDDQTIRAKYTDPHFISDNFMLKTQFKYINDISYRFYGIGPNTRIENESNYTHNMIRWKGKLLYHLTKTLNISLQERISRVKIKPGKITELPYSMDMFPTVPGIKGSNTWTNTIALTFDNRDSESITTEGYYATIYTSLAQKVFNTDSSFLQYGTHLKMITPIKSKKHILVLRSLFDKQDGHNIPFYERSMLGGEDTLRGFGMNRFFGNNRILFSAELRILLFQTTLFDVTSDWEVAPFVETGRVFDSYELPLFKEFKLVSGVGVRAIVRPNVIGRVDIGLGPEGVKVFVGLGYPF